ncbi:MAG: PilZ domain-containing protein [Magnetococcales bacterium]|nr:PilZ domain-containing protein [Magnetococcales bacterium]
MFNRIITSPTQDRRHFSRVDFCHELDLVNDKTQQLYQGAFNDISLKGLLFCAEELPKPGEQVSGVLSLGEISLTIRGTVLWAKEHRGAAIQFQDMDLESFSHLRRLITLNMGDSERIDQELFSSL